MLSSDDIVLSNNRIHNHIRNFGNILERCLVAFGTFCLVFFLIVVFLDVTFRIIGSPVVWMQELATFAFMWTVFIGAAIGFRRGTHYNVNMFAESKSVKLKRVLEFIVFVCEAVFIYVLIVFGYKFAMLGLERVSMPSGIPVFYGSVSIPVGAIFMLYFLIELISAWILEQKGEKKC